MAHFRHPWGNTYRIDYGPIQKKLDIDKKVSRSWRKFDISNHSAASKYTYSRYLDEFMRFAKIERYDDVKKLKPDDMQDLFEDWIMNIPTQTYTNCHPHFCAVSKFLEINRIMFWPKAVKGLIPENKGAISGKSPYTLEDVVMMLENTPKNGLRAKAIIHFFNSTGGRPGTADDEDGHLLCKDIEDMPDGCACITMYAETPSQYWSFLTPEAYTIFKRYFEVREASGETITPESPMFGLVNKYQSGNNFATLDTIYSILYRIVSKSVPRKKMSNGNYDKSITYGFRKRFNGILKIDSDVNSNIAEKLMSHNSKTIKLDTNYLEPSKMQCFKEFKKAIPELTINREAKLRVENIQLRAEENKVTEEKIMQVFDLAESDMVDLKEFLKQKRKDRKYK